jgi:hypothetical protein
MKHCPNCAAPSDGLVPFCWHCGRDAKEPLQAFTPETVAPDPLPTAGDTAPPVDKVMSRSSDVVAPSADQLVSRSSDVKPPSVDQVISRSNDREVAPAAVAIAANPAGRRWSYWALACAGVLVGLATMLAIGRKGIDPPAQASPSVAASNNVPVPADPKPMLAEPEKTIESEPAPTWMGARRANVGRDGSKTIAFELTARNDVGVWMKRVQPLLVVRCLARETEVFVAIGSAASIEQQADSHTVHLQFDDAEPVAEPWSDSVSSQELYAPDGVTFARRLARAGTLRFGFTPYNSRPVVAEFDVRGFDQLVGLVAGTCGWRVDDSLGAEKRRAALN